MPTRTFMQVSGLPPISTGEEKKEWSLRLPIGPIRWSYFSTISKDIQGELMFSEASLSHTNLLKGGNSWTDLKFGFGRYIDDFFDLRTDKKKWLGHTTAFGDRFIEITTRG